MCSINITVIATTDSYSELLGFMLKTRKNNGPVSGLDIVKGSVNGERYIALKVTAGSPGHNWFIGTTLCSDISVIKIVDTIENEFILSNSYIYFTNAADEEIVLFSLPNP